jgi:F-type H+-transporting ATPase subunit b
MENLGIDGKLLLAQLINFAIFFFLVKKYIAKPFLKFLQQERDNEKEKEELLDKLKKGDLELQTKEVKLKETARKEQAAILEKARQDAVKLRQEIVSEAKKEAENIKEKARRELQEEKEKLHQDVKNKVADLSILLTEKTLSTYLEEESRKKITKNILKNLN